MRASGRVGRSTAPAEGTVRGHGFCHGQARAIFGSNTDALPLTTREVGCAA